MKAIIMCLVMFFIGNTALAAPHLWYDKSVAFKDIKKVVVLPVEGESIIGAEDEWKTILEKKVKKIHFLFLEADNSQEDILLEENADHEYILQNKFDSEEERGKAIQELTGANAYIICKVRENEEQIDWSPETVCNVTIRKYTEESGGPDGYRQYDESSYDTTYTVKGQYVYLHKLDLDYYMFDTSGNKIMLLKNRVQGYDDGVRDQFKELFKEFAEELKDVRKHEGKW